VHTPVSIDELYDLVTEHFGDRLSQEEQDSEGLIVGGVLYESFELVCSLDAQYGTFGAAIMVGKTQWTSDFFGESISMNADPRSILSSLETIDRWCRLRLPDKFLEVFDARG
jgi:hypothetical protein